MGRRILTRVDGIEIEPVGPNRMDTPYGYVAGSQVATLRLYRGIAPVSAGIETFAGAVSLETQTLGFGSGERPSIHGKAGIHAARPGSATSADVLFGLADRRRRLQIAWSRERGGDVDFPGGTIRPSRHERETFGVRAGWRGRAGEVSLDYRRLNIGRTGTPALPMDILFVRSDLVRLGYSRSFGDTLVRASVSVSDSRHAMANVGLRPAPAPMMQRRSNPSGELVGWRVDVGTTARPANFRFGIDGDYATHDVDVRNPSDRAFFIEAFRNVVRFRQGAFVEYERGLGRGLRIDAGLRYAAVFTDAGRIDTSMSAPPIVRLRDRFNGSDRSQVDHHVDWVVGLTVPVASAAQLRIEAGRKMRSPSYQERYLWLPLEITGGLADGNNYVGTAGLRPEVAHELDVGLTWRVGPLLVSPQAFYRRVDDYIQGVPATDPDVLAVSAMTGDPTPLRFANVDAEIYGVDGDWKLELGPKWSVSGSAAFTRGRRRDHPDDLFRVAPPNASAVLAYRGERWLAAFESIVFARQRN
ncbi:MAG: TonB-dependent receptor, partial [Deltaproteobacteria bacterium]